MKLHFVSCMPDDLVFWWQTFVQLSNFREMGYSDKTRILIYLPFDRLQQGFNPKWKELQEHFPETQFFFYADTESLLFTIKKIGYIPLLRPWLLMKHFEQYPELEKDAIFYLDSDVLFIKAIDFEPLLQDDTCYLSFTGNRKGKYNYIDASHFEHKLGNVREEVKNQAIEEDVLTTLLSTFSLPKERFIEAPQDTIGGAQSLLKDVNAAFFKELLSTCITVKAYLGNFNQRYMKGNTPQEREDNGIQSWAADMWCLLFLLWENGKETKCPPQMDFLWSTDTIDKWDEFYIYHDAGAGPEQFQKRALPYVNNIRTPFQDDLSWVNPAYCSYNYTKQINKTKQLFNL